MYRRYAVIAAVGALALGASPAAAHTRPNVKCGQTLTQSVRLNADLVNCPGDGLVIGAAGITVDLDGHTLDGVAHPAGCDIRPVTAGIRNPGFDRVTIADGTIRQFDAGLEAGSDGDGMSDSRLRGLVLRELRGGISLGSGAGTAATARNRIEANDLRGIACGAAIELNTGRANRFAENRLRDVATGIVICCGDADDGNVVAGNDIARAQFDGVLVFESGATRIAGNTLADLAGSGIVVAGSRPDTVVADNRLVRVQGAGILGEADEGTTGARITGNTLAAVGDGIVLFQFDRSFITGNTVTGAGTIGDPGNIGFGVLLDGTSGTLVAGNVLRDGRGPGVQVGAQPDQQPSPLAPTGNVVARNEVFSNQADGILVAAAARQTALERNEADRNGGDGIHVLSPLTTLTRNDADRNTRFGIEAVPGVTDGGGNHARGNGAGQCSGVSC